MPLRIPPKCYGSYWNDTGGGDDISLIHRFGRYYLDCGGEHQTAKRLDNSLIFVVHVRIIAKEGKIVRYPLFRVSVKTSSSAMKRANRNNEIFSLFSTAIWMEWRIG